MKTPTCISLVAMAAQETIIAATLEKFGPLTDRERDMIKHAVYAACVGTLRQLPIAHRALGTDRDVQEWWRLSAAQDSNFAIN